MKKQFSTFTLLLLIATSVFTQNWLTTGNAIAGTEKLGTTNNQSLNIYTNNLVRLKISNTGLVSIGTSTPAATDKLTVRSIVPAPTGIYTETKGIFSDLSGNAYSSYDNLGIAVYGKCNNNNNHGYGGYLLGDYNGTYNSGIGYMSLSIGAYGVAENYGGTAFGISGAAVKSTTAYNYGVQGYADAGTTNNVGVIGIQGPSGPGSAGFFSGDIEYTGNIYDVSDAQFKSNIQKISGALDKVKLLSPKIYNLNQNKFQGLNFGTAIEFGFVAQEIQKVFPELVKSCISPVNPTNAEEAPSTTSPFEYLAVNYSGLIPVLTAAIQEQQTIIEYQQSTIISQEEVIADLISRVGKLESRSTINIAMEDRNTAWIGQNSPNPFSGNTQIAYYIPEVSQSAEVKISDMFGKQIMVIPIGTFGSGLININASNIPSGNYLYTLIVDEIPVDSKSFSTAK